VSTMMERIQTVIFVRHAVARHNVADPVTGKPPCLLQPSLTDPPLTPHGKIQAVAAGEAIQTWLLQQQQHQR
jgi:broad specificity phosphatase PhoE